MTSLPVWRALSQPLERLRFLSLYQSHPPIAQAQSIIALLLSSCNLTPLAPNNNGSLPLVQSRVTCTRSGYQQQVDDCGVRYLRDSQSRSCCNTHYHYMYRVRPNTEYLAVDNGAGPRRSAPRDMLCCRHPPAQSSGRTLLRQVPSCTP